MRKPTTLLLVLAVGLSCSKDSGTGPTFPATISVIPDSTTVNLFDHVQLRAVVINNKGDTLNEAVSWSASPTTVAYVSPTGLTQGLSRGTATIHAALDGVEGLARVKVKITVIQVQLQPTGGTVHVGDTLRIKDTLITANGQLPDDSIVTWTSSDTTKAVVSTTGLVTGRAQGSVTISAQVDSAIAHAIFAIPEPVTSLTLSAHLDTLRQDSVFLVTATPIGTANDTLFTTPVTWTSSDTSVAKLSTGPFNASISAFKPGRAVIRAQISTHFDSCVVIVARPSVAIVAVSPDTGRKILPGAFSLHATVKDSTGVLLGGRVITWSLSDTSIASVAPDSGTDVVLTGKSQGVVRVRATSEGKVDSSATFQFLHPSVASVTVTPDTGSFTIPDAPAFALHADVRDSTGDTLTDRVVNWSVLDTAVAQVQATTGSDIYILGRHAGTAAVVASSGGHADTVHILVIRRSVAHVVLSPDTVTLVAPGTLDITATPEDSLNQPLTGRVIKWTLPDTAVASLSDTIGGTVTITGKITGTAHVIATSEGVTDTATVHVNLPPVAKVVLLNLLNGAAVDTTHLLSGNTRMLGAEALDSNNVQLNRTITFSSTDSAVLLPAFLAVSGFESIVNVTGKTPGAAVFTATSGGVSTTWHASVYTVGYDTVAAGNGESCMTASDGLVYCWGENPNSPYPTPVVTPAGMHALTAKLGLACGLDPSGNAYCWGVSFGPNGTSGVQGFDTARAVTGGTLFSQVDVGWDHLCGVTTTGGLSCWGNNDKAQLGFGDSIARTSPTALTVGATFTSVSSGYQHTCAIATGGILYCWGANGSGQSGQPLGGDIGTPTVVDTALKFGVVSSGFDHTCALTATGAAYCWGSNAFGQLGTGDQTDRSAPTAVSGGLTFKSIAAAEYATCGVTSGGAAYCWGNDVYLALGNSAQASSLVPLAVGGGLSFTSISAGIASNGTVCGMTTGGAYCWGIGAAGGATKTPVKIPGQP